MNKSFKKLLLSAVIAGTSLSAFATGPDISGYFDMAFVAPEKKQAYWRQQHLNLLMSHSVDKFKFFAEIEFEDAVDLDFGRKTTAMGTLNSGVLTSKTGIGRLFIERAYAEYAVTPYDSIRFGQLLSSTLYYENHYPSIVVNYTDPLTRKSIFDYNIKGIMILGERKGFLYDVWSGKNPQTTSATTNESVTTYGGKLGYHYATRDLDVRFAGLYANYGTSSGDTIPERIKATGAEISVNYKAFTLWSEYGVRDDKKVATNKVTAGYVIASYAFDLGSKGEIIPFYMYDQYKKESDTVAETSAAVTGKTMTRNSFGFSYRPVPTITWKLEYSKVGSFHSGTKYAEPNFDKVAAQLVYFYN